MTEYVCEIVPDYDGVDIDSDDFSGECRPHERVVRCRDCKSYRSKFRSCERFNDPGDDSPAFVEEDGFCAWGEPMEGE